MRTITRLLILSACIMAAGCLGSGMAPFDPVSVFTRSAANRADLHGNLGGSPAAALLPEPGWREGPGVLPSLIDRLLKANPEIREAAAAAEAAAIAARTGSPWGDPYFQGGPSASPGGAAGAGWFASMSVSIPIGGRAGKEASLLDAEARAAGVSLRAVAVEQAIELRLAVARVMNSASTLRTAAESLDWARRGTTLANRAAKAGSASAVDVQLAVAEERAAMLAALEAQDMLENDKSALCALLSLDVSALPSIQAIPPEWAGPPQADRKAVVSAMLELSPDLALRRAACDSSDLRLALERTRSFPDVDLGISAEAGAGEPGVTVGIPLGFSIPLFDGNAAAVAQARGAALAAREAYSAGVDRLLSNLDALTARSARLRERLGIMDKELLPEHAAALASAAKAMEQADFEALRYIEMQRTFREWKIQREGIMRELIETASLIERIAGKPLFRLPSGK